MHAGSLESTREASCLDILVSKAFSIKPNNRENLLNVTVEESA